MGSYTFRGTASVARQAARAQLFYRSAHCSIEQGGPHSGMGHHSKNVNCSPFGALCDWVLVFSDDSNLQPFLSVMKDKYPEQTFMFTCLRDVADCRKVYKVLAGNVISIASIGRRQFYAPQSLASRILIRRASMYLLSGCQTWANPRY